MIRAEQFDSLGNPTAYTEFLTVPEFPGGTEGIARYLQQNLRYPKIAKEHNIQGTVVVRFNIDREGKAIPKEIKQGVSNSIDAEAVRIIEMMPEWKPATVDDVPIDIFYMLPIAFRLED